MMHLLLACGYRTSQNDVNWLRKRYRRLHDLGKQTVTLLRGLTIAY